MYIEEFLDLINELDLRKLNLKKKQAQQLKTIVIEAGHEYNIKKSLNRLTEDIKFNIDGQYIEDSELLSKLGISVYPSSWKQLFTSYGGNPFGPSDSVSFTRTECKTSVVFPTRLFEKEKKANVLKRLRSKK